jgi:hypothetical protein
MSGPPMAVGHPSSRQLDRGGVRFVACRWLRRMRIPTVHPSHHLPAHLEPSMNTQTPRTLGLRPLAHRVTALALAAGITFSVLAGLGQEADRSHDEARYAQTTRGLLSCQAAMAETGSKPA